jgi:hypothetical protein
MPKLRYRGTRRKRNYKRKRSVRGGKASLNMHVTTHPPKEINDLISHVIYINLDKRDDRKKHIEKELSIFNPEKITRLPAVIDAHPTTGCAKSHYNALKLARDNKYPNVLIVEDDACWNKVNESFPVLQRLLKEPYDGIALGIFGDNFDKDTLRVHGGFTTHAYIVKEPFYEKYIKMYEDAISKEGDTPKGTAYIYSDGLSQNAYKNGNWYVVSPSLMTQIPTYSNINMAYKNITGSIN